MGFVFQSFLIVVAANLFCARIFNSESRYNIILGHDEIGKTGLTIIDHGKHILKWNSLTVNFKTDEFFKVKTTMVNEMLDAINKQETVKMFAETDKIRHREDKDVTPEEVMTEHNHMTAKQKQSFLNTISPYIAVFDGTLGQYPHQQITTELINPVPRRNLYNY